MAKKVAVPPRNYDDQLESFIAFLKQYKITILGPEAKQLGADLKAQREEKQKDQEAERQYEQIHRKFLENQAERYRRYGTALQVVRAANRNNQDLLNAMEQFKRRRTIRATKKPSKT